MVSWLSNRSRQRSSPQGGGPLGGANDVGEHDRGQYPLCVGAAAHAGDKFLDFVEHRRGVADPVQGIGAG